MAESGNKVKTHLWGRDGPMAVQPCHTSTKYPGKNERNLYKLIWMDFHNEQSKLEKGVSHILCVFVWICEWFYVTECGEKDLIQGGRIRGMFLLPYSFT